MPRTIALVALIPLSLLFACAAEDDAVESTTNSIIGGNLVPEGRADALPFVRLDIGNYSHCSGTLITTDWVLTAAHCVIGVSPASIWVSPNADGGGANADYTYVSPLYEPPDPAAQTATRFDFALVHLQQRLLTNQLGGDYRLPLCHGEVTVGTWLHCYGWGLSTVNPPSGVLDLQLHEGWMPVVERVAENFRLGSNGQDMTHGDSGAGCVYESPSGTRCLGAVHSANTFGYYGNVIDSFEFNPSAWWHMTYKTLRNYNLARSRPTQQSSTGWAGDSSRAVDGSPDGDYNHGSVTHTLLDQNAWWEVDLGAVGYVDHIELTNRWDCCAERLSNYYVLVSERPFVSTSLDVVRAQPDVFQSWQAGGSAPSTRVFVGRRGRYVRIQLAGAGYLSLGEVDVEGMRNIALGKPATQSSTVLGADAARAIDGNTSGQWSDGSVTHTDWQQPAWWQVDLGASFKSIDHVEIFNRTDCCSERLGHFTAYISDNPLPRGADGRPVPDATTWTGAFELDATGVPVITLNPRHAGGRYLLVQLNQANYLSLAEVMVFGYQE